MKLIGTTISVLLICGCAKAMSHLEVAENRDAQALTTSEQASRSSYAEEFEKLMNAEESQPMAGERPVDDLSSDDENNGEESSAPWNLKTPTLGGKQFWTDYVFLHSYRIQRNAWSGHYRLLNPDDHREAWGSLAVCQRKLREIADAQDLKPMSGSVVIALHGLGRSRSSMVDMAEYLNEELDLQPVRLGYASTRAEIANHAEALASVIEHMPEVDKIYFVAHSMGNIVIRHYMADQMKKNGGRLDPRIQRFVMLAPPNQGSAMAEFFKRNPLFHVVWGRSGKQLSKSWEELEPNLTVPPIEFGIIAGGDGTAWNTNPLLKGDDDLIVTVEETKLQGARDFLIVRAAHTFLMDNDQVMEATASFFKNGYFVAEDQRQPLDD